MGCSIQPRDYDHLIAMKVEVEVVRAVLWDGAVREKGEVISVEYRDARELMSSGKVVQHQSAPIVVHDGPMTTENYPAIVPGRQSRRKA